MNAADASRYAAHIPDAGLAADKFAEIRAEH